MLSGHFYHKAIVKRIVAFATLFNDMRIVRRNNAGGVTNIMRVPLAYGPGKKVLARVKAQTNLSDPKVAIRLPRMSFEITSLAYDAQSKLGKMNRVVRGRTGEHRQTLFTYSPYTMGIQLSLIVNNQDDGLQLVEQILPYFQPEYTVTIIDVPDMDIKTDSPITLSGVSMSEDYEGDFISRRAIIYTLDFEMKVRFYGPEKEAGIIQTVDVDLHDANTLGFLEEIVADGTGAEVETGVDETDDGRITP